MTAAAVEPSSEASSKRAAKVQGKVPCERSCYRSLRSNVSSILQGALILCVLSTLEGFGLVQPSFSPLTAMLAAAVGLEPPE